MARKKEVAFLKVDVEGWDTEVLASGDWGRHRPVVIVVEAVDEEGRPTHEAWEPDLLANRYRFALFDGLNRFYVREEDAERFRHASQRPRTSSTAGGTRASSMRSDGPRSLQPSVRPPRSAPKHSERMRRKRVPRRRESASCA